LTAFVRFSLALITKFDHFAGVGKMALGLLPEVSQEVIARSIAS
jgi:hypothetical protein